MYPPMVMHPLFTVNFDVTSSDNYGQFIANLCYRDGQPEALHTQPPRPLAR